MLSVFEEFLSSYILTCIQVTYTSDPMFSVSNNLSNLVFSAYSYEHKQATHTSGQPKARTFWLLTNWMCPEMFPDTEAKYHDLAVDMRRLCRNWLLETTFRIFWKPNSIRELYGKASKIHAKEHINSLMTQQHTPMPRNLPESMGFPTMCRLFWFHLKIDSGTFLTQA